MKHVSMTRFFLFAFAISALVIPVVAWAGTGDEATSGEVADHSKTMEMNSGDVAGETAPPEEGSAGEHGAAEDEEPKPMEEFSLHPMWFDSWPTPAWFERGVDAEGEKTYWLDMRPNKAVIYLWVAALICCAWAVWMSKRMKLRPNKKQTFTELFYEFAYDHIATATLGPKVFSRYMPYVACLFVFLWTVNILSFFPLPFNTETVEIFGTEIPMLALYAATSNINVTLALTLVTFIASHYEGIRINGPVKYFGSWAPPGSFALKAFIWPLHALSELLRLVSLSVRLFANMLAGHLLILMMLSLILIIGSVWVAIGAVPIALFFFLFEFALVASLQAFIFAMLSGIYIGFAAEPQH